MSEASYDIRPNRRKPYCTRTARSKDGHPQRELFKKAVLDKMFADGHGPDEVLAHINEYCAAIFVCNSKTGRSAIIAFVNGLSREPPEPLPEPEYSI